MLYTNIEKLEATDARVQRQRMSFKIHEENRELLTVVTVTDRCVHLVAGLIDCIVIDCWVTERCNCECTHAEVGEDEDSLRNTETNPPHSVPLLVSPWYMR